SCRRRVNPSKIRKSSAKSDKRPKFPPQKRPDSSPSSDLAALTNLCKFKPAKLRLNQTFLRRYNDDDCRSTQLLRDWLLTHRPETLPWFSGEVRDEDAKDQSRSERIRRLEEGLARHRDALLGGL